MVNPAGMNALLPSDIRKGAEKFANLSDEELLYLAHNKTLSEQKAKRNKSFNNAVIKAVPVVDSAIFASQRKEMLGLTAGSTLAPTLGAFATRLASWGFFLGVFDITSKIFNKATKKSEKLSDLKENHPLLHMGADLGLGLVAYKGTKAAGKQLLESLPTSTKKKIIDKLITFKYKINESNISKNVFEPMVKKVVEFSKNHPKIAEKLPVLKRFAVPAVLTGMLVKLMIIDPIATNRKIEKNFTEFKADQQAVRILLDTDSAEGVNSQEF